MCSLSSRELQEMGFERTGRESPIAEEGELWSNGHEIICDETSVVIDGNHHVDNNEKVAGRTVYRYRNSKKVKLPGGYVGSYAWGSSNGQFEY